VCSCNSTRPNGLHTQHRQTVSNGHFAIFANRWNNNAKVRLFFNSSRLTNLDAKKLEQKFILESNLEALFDATVEQQVVKIVFE